LKVVYSPTKNNIFEILIFDIFSQFKSKLSKFFLLAVNGIWLIEQSLKSEQLESSFGLF